MHLPGRLKATTLGDLLGALHRSAASGSLELAETTKVKERLQIAETLAGTPQVPPAAGRVAPPLPMRSKPPPDLPKKSPSIPPKNEVVEGASPSPSASEPRDVEKPS